MEIPVTAEQRRGSSDRSATPKADAEKKNRERDSKQERERETCIDNISKSEKEERGEKNGGVFSPSVEQHLKPKTAILSSSQFWTMTMDMPSIVE